MERILDRLNLTLFYTLDGDSWFEAYYVFEAVSLGVSFVGLALFLGAIHIVSAIPQFHHNFQILMFNVMFNFLFMTVTRQVSIICIWLTRNDIHNYQTQLFFLTRFKWLEDLKYCTMVNHIVMVYVLILERTYATVHAKTYEQRRMNVYCALLLVLPWIVTVVGVYSMTLGFFPVTPAALVCAFLSYPIFFGYYYVSRMNSRRYLLSKSMNTAYTLSERFQLSENLRTTPIINRIIVGAVVLNTPEFVVMMAMMYLDTVNQKLVCKILFDVICTLYPFVMVILILSSNQRWKRRAVQLLRFNFKGQRARVDVVTPSMEVVQNQQLIRSRIAETDAYFHQLRDSWN